MTAAGRIRGFGIEMTRLTALKGTRVERKRDSGGIKYRILPGPHG